MIPAELFHYTKRETAIEKIMFTKKLKLGQLGATNDPKESKRRIFFSKEEAAKDANWWDRFSSITDEATNIIAKEWKVLCVSKNHPDYKGDGNKIHSGDCKPRMWASYADNHQGFCFRFDGEKLNRQIEKELSERAKIFHGDIEYDDTKSIGVPRIDFNLIEKVGIKEGMRAHLLEYWKENFLLKSKDWETECEYRWLIHNTEDKPEFISIEDSLTGVVIGEDFPKTYIPLVKDFCADLRIQAARIQWQNGQPILNYIDPQFLT